MAKWPLPKIEKVYEAISAVLDERVEIRGEHSASVTSSSRDKAYTVDWSADDQRITSNDNATHFQGYMGYPIIAVLIQRGAIDLNREAVEGLKDIHWKAINKKYKNDYGKAVEHVLGDLADRGSDISSLKGEVSRIYEKLGSLGLEPLRARRLPPGK